MSRHTVTLVTNALFQEKPQVIRTNIKFVSQTTQDKVEKSQRRLENYGYGRKLGKCGHAVTSRGGLRSQRGVDPADKTETKTEDPVAAV